jgi:cob(I)alamin adenosyltransferase
VSEKGLTVILTGNGKGKSSSAFGMIIRSLGWGRRVLLVQFLKGLWETGEENFFGKLSDNNLEILRAECPFTWKSTDKEKDARICREVWGEALKRISDKHYDMVVFDELMITLHQGFLGLDQVLDFLNARSEGLDVVLTGRNAPQELIAIADTVSEIRVVKHAFDKGSAAKKGIDF